MMVLKELELGSLDRTDSFCGSKGKKAIFLVGRVRKRGRKFLTFLTIINFNFKYHLQRKFCIHMNFIVNGSGYRCLF